MSSEGNWKGGEREQRGGQILSPKMEQSVFKEEDKALVLASDLGRPQSWSVVPGSSRS